MSKIVTYEFQFSVILNICLHLIVTIRQYFIAQNPDHTWFSTTAAIRLTSLFNRHLFTESLGLALFFVFVVARKTVRSLPGVMDTVFLFAKPA